jgi:hypothetical protein
VPEQLHYLEHRKEQKEHREAVLDLVLVGDFLVYRRQKGNSWIQLEVAGNFHQALEAMQTSELVTSFVRQV